MKRAHGQGAENLQQETASKLGGRECKERLLYGVGGGGEGSVLNTGKALVNKSKESCTVCSPLRDSRCMLAR